MISSISGPGARAILDLKPILYWDALRSGVAHGAGIEGDGNVKITQVDDDSDPGTDEFGVWDPGNERWKFVTPTGDPDKVLGPAGMFYDGSLTQRWPSWTTTTLGFSAVSPTPAGALYEESGVYPDILDGATHNDVTVLDTDGESQAVIVEAGITLSASYSRIVQFFIKSEDGHNPMGLWNKLTDGDQETSGTAAWSAVNNAALTKDTNDPHGGTQCLKVAYVDTANPAASQTVFTIGNDYRVSGWVYGDGSTLPKVSYGDGTVIWTGSPTASWQYFEVELINAPHTDIHLINVTSGTGHAFFDDLIVMPYDERLAFIGLNSSSGTRTVSTSTWARPLPGSRGWWAIMLTTGSGSGTIYASISVPQDTGRWFVAAPSWYSIWSIMENVVRPPASPSAQSRGGWYIETTNSEIIMKPQGWIAGSIVLPDRSTSWGHKDLSGASNYRFLGMFNLDCTEGYRLRVSMSDSNDHLTVHLGTILSATIAYLDFQDDWNDFAGFGFVACWEVVNGSQYTTLYVNGEKLDAGTVTPGDWYAANLTPDVARIGISASSGTFGECWLSHFAMGRRIHRAYARALSKRMYELARGKRDQGFTEPDY
jgi:hypothetical protein